MDRFNKIRSIAEECINDEELRELLDKKKHPLCYDGFEPSGKIHIAQGIMKARIVNTLTAVGCRFVFVIADTFAYMNKKGTMQEIRERGRRMIHIWKGLGMDMNNVEFVWSSDIMDQEYWNRVIDITRVNTVSRIKRCAQIMGRENSDELSVSQLLYPCMQCADIFHLDVDICQLGMDQRKVNMLAREYVPDGKKPIILSHHMLSGLDGSKMSKSNPENAIFMEDSAADVKRKISRAYCKPCDIECNPLLEYAKYVIFPDEFTIIRKDVHGGNKVYNDYDDLEHDFASGELHPTDLKKNIATAINKKLSMD